MIHTELKYARYNREANNFTSVHNGVPDATRESSTTISSRNGHSGI